MSWVPAAGAFSPAITRVGDQPGSRQHTIQSLCFITATLVNCLGRVRLLTDTSRQVDRVLALWQALHPKAWIDKESGKKGWFSVSANGHRF
jgi:hypothetical protein